MARKAPLPTHYFFSPLAAAAANWLEELEVWQSAEEKQ